MMKVIWILRPLASIRKRLKRFSNHMKFPTIPCDLCGSQDGLERKIKKMLEQWELDFPGG